MREHRSPEVVFRSTRHVSKEGWSAMPQSKESPSGLLTIDPEFAELCPPLSAEERSLLEASMDAEGGCREPIAVWGPDEIIVDGHNRYDISCQLGLEFKTRRMKFDSREDVIEWIVANQLGRRNLSEEQKSYLRGRRRSSEKSRHGGDRKSTVQNEHLNGGVDERLADEYGVSEMTIRRDEQFSHAVDTLAHNVSPELKTEILSGNSDLTKKAVVEIAELPAEEQPAAVEAAKVRKWSKTPTAPVVHDDSPGDICTDLTDLISSGQRFGTIYADPPWRYDNSGTRGNVEGTYAGTMTVAEICALPVADLAADASHCHLWTTNAFLRDAYDVLEAWGFEYKSMFVWVKPQMGMGNYWRVSHEIMLLGIRGDAKRFNDRSIKSWGQYDRREHSEKPDEVRTLIERVSPGPFLELFGRKTVAGWTVYGNQVERMLV